MDRCTVYVCLLVGRSWLVVGTAMNEIWYLEDPDYHDYDPNDIPTYGTKHLTDRYKRGEHVMNSHEATVMRRIQSETGKSEEEVREIKKYRIELSEAQKAEGPGSTNDQRIVKRLLRSVTRKTGLAAAHPVVVEEAMKLANDCDSNGFGFMRRTCSSHSLAHVMKELIRSKS